VAHPIFHTPSEKVKKPHIAYDVEPAPVKKHVAQKGEIIPRRKSMNQCPFWRGIPCRDKAKKIKDFFQDVFGNGDLKDEDDRI
jgi:hypothetical protein